MSDSYPPNGTKIKVKVAQWKEKQVIFEDIDGLRYVHWMEDDARWNTNEWYHLLDEPDLEALVRVGRSMGPFGMKCFMEAVFDPNPVQPKQESIPGFTQPSLKSTAVINVTSTDTPVLDFSSLQIRFENDQAAWLRAVAHKNGIPASAVASKCIAQSMAWHGEGISE